MPRWMPSHALCFKCSLPHRLRRHLPCSAWFPAGCRAQWLCCSLPLVLNSFSLGSSSCWGHFILAQKLKEHSALHHQLTALISSYIGAIHDPLPAQHLPLSGAARCAAQALRRIACQTPGCRQAKLVQRFVPAPFVPPSVNLFQSTKHAPSAAQHLHLQHQHRQSPAASMQGPCTVHIYKLTITEIHGSKELVQREEWQRCAGATRSSVHHCRQE